MDGKIFYNASRAYFWSEAVIRQGKRAIDGHKLACNISMEIFDRIRKFDPLNRNSDSPMNFIDTTEDHEFEEFFLGHMEDHFFLTALAKSIDYLGLTKEYRHILDDIFNALGGKQNILDVRNMREHDEEYINGEGLVRERFFTEGGDATGTLIDFQERQLILGDRINVYDAIDIYEKHISEIKNIYHKMRGY